ncbi:MAG: hypothetical protein M0006_01540 [Magnetospirillum sp.]|nr:hypothetical protein [Magnetospirillum sp.]
MTIRLGGAALSVIFTILATSAANAQCFIKVGAPYLGSQAKQNQAQTMVSESQDGTVSAAYTAGTCTITKGLHPGGRPCPGTQIDSHVTVELDHVNGQYHVIDHLIGGQYCTTH